MAVAGDITLPVVSTVGISDTVTSQWYQKGAITELGNPLDVKTILPAERLSIVQHMAALVARLHDQGIIHGNIKPESFFKRLQDDQLALVDFSSARMADGSDLSTWSSDIPSVEYSSPNRRQKNEPSTMADDIFALAVSIWAVFAGEKPMKDLFSSNEGHMPDLTKITNDDMFCAVVDFLKAGGLRVDCPGTLARRDTLGLDRAVSFPLSLFDADFEGDDEMSATKKKPQFCAHCFQIAMSSVDKANGMDPGTQVMYPEFCHLKTATHDKEAASDYALQWLKEQELATGAEILDEAVLQSNAKVAPHTNKLSGQKPMLQVKTTADGDIEKALGSATSSVTVVPTTCVRGRDRSGTVVNTLWVASTESDEGYGSMGHGSESSISFQSRPRGSSFQRTMSHWSESSFGSCSEDDEGESEGSEPDWSSLPQTPMPPKSMRLQVTSSFESVTLTDDDQ